MSRRSGSGMVWQPAKRSAGYVQILLLAVGALLVLVGYLNVRTSGGAGIAAFVPEAADLPVPPPIPKRARAASHSTAPRPAALPRQAAAPRRAPPPRAAIREASAER
jgi:hypothetical protein